MNQRLEQIARGLLALLDTRQLSRSQVEEFVAGQGAKVAFVPLNDYTDARSVEKGQEDPMIVVHDDTDGVALPPIRVGMFRLNMQKHFNTVGWNGIDPIRGSDLRQLPSLRSGPEHSWLVVEKGLVRPEPWVRK